MITAVFFLKVWSGGHFKKVETLRNYLDQYGGMRPFVLVPIQALQVVHPVFPGLLGCIVGAAMFGAAGDSFYSLFCTVVLRKGSLYARIL